MPSTLYLGLRLSGEAFANALMIYEFLHNFGETLGFDMDSLPNMDSLQAALLYDQEAEEELLSVVIHLVLVAIEDPGIPFFNKHLTLLGQNLKQADFTNTNISEVMRIFLTARGRDIYLDNTTMYAEIHIFLSPVQRSTEKLEVIAQKPYIFDQFKFSRFFSSGVWLFFFRKCAFISVKIIWHFGL